MIKQIKNGVVKNIVLPCKSPRCPICSKSYLKKLINSLEDIISHNTNLDMAMITLTLAPEHYINNFKWLSKQWNRVRSILKKNIPEIWDYKDTFYIRVIEKGSLTNRLHIHLLIVTRSNWLIPLSYAICDAWKLGITDIKINDPDKGNLPKYICKYLMKDESCTNNIGKISKSRRLSEHIKKRSAIEKDSYLNSIGDNSIRYYLPADENLMKLLRQNKFAEKLFKKDIMKNGKTNEQTLNRLHDRRGKIGRETYSSREITHKEFLELIEQYGTTYLR